MNIPITPGKITGRTTVLVDPGYRGVVRQIVRTVAREFGVDHASIIESRCKKEPLSTARMVAMSLCADHLSYASLRIIGREFNREKDTIRWARRAVLGRMRIYPAFQAKIQTIKARLAQQ